MSEEESPKEGGRIIADAENPQGGGDYRAAWNLPGLTDAERRKLRNDYLERHRRAEHPKRYR